MPVYKLTANSVNNGRTIFNKMLAGNSTFNPSVIKLIQNTTLSSPQGSVLFDSIPQTYKHLQIIINGKGVNTLYHYGHVWMRFNGLSSSIYGGLKNQAFNSDWGASISAFGSYPTDTLDFGYMIDNISTTENMFGSTVVDIPNYTSTDRNKSTTSHFGLITGVDSGQNFSTSGFASGFAATTNAITSIVVGNYGGNWNTGTTMTLYGIEG